MSFWTVLPWVMSCITLYSVFLAGNKTITAWWLALGNQGLWLLFITHNEAWGLLPMTGGMIVMVIRNLRKWRVEQRYSQCLANFPKSPVSIGRL